MKELINIRDIFSWRRWKELIKLNQAEIQITNMNLVFLISLVMMTIGAAMTVTAFLIKDTHLAPIWVGLVVVSIIFILLSSYGKKNSVLSKIIIYLFPSVLFLGALYSVYFVKPRANFISIIVFLVIIPLMFIERPERITVFHLILTALCVILNFKNPSPILPSGELISNYLFCGIGGILFGIYTGYIKLMAVENSRLIKQMARSDESLHILNRNSFFEDYAFNNEQNELVGLFMIDVNGFKAVNDTYGHLFGDECLKTIAEILNKIGDENNITFYRYGGDEFVGAYKENNSDNVVPDKIISIIKDKISGYSISAKNGDTVHISISVGYSEIAHAETNSLEDCLHEADVMMYQDKKRYHKEKPVTVL